MKLLPALLLGLCAANASAAPIRDLPAETYSYYYSAGQYHELYGYSSYDISFTEQDLLIDVDIKLTGDDPGDSLMDTWRNGMQDIWSKAFDIFDGTYLYDIVFNVDWVDEDADADHFVNVIAGSGQTSLTDWYTERPYTDNSIQGYVAAHEFGHMFGLYDEYEFGGTKPGAPTIREDSIMGMYMTRPHADHYDGLLNWLSTGSGSTFTLLADAGDHFFAITEMEITDVPATPSAALFGIGIAGILIRSRRRRTAMGDRTTGNRNS